MLNGLSAAQLNALYESLIDARVITQPASAVEGGTPLYDLELEENNMNLVVLASAVRAATVNGADRVNRSGRGLIVTFDITAVPGVQTVTLSIQGKDQASGKYNTILAGAAEAGVAQRTYKVYPGLVAAANAVANDVLPRDWRIVVTHSGAGNFIYSVGAAIIK